MKKKIVCTLLALSMISGSVSACSSTKNDVGTTTETEDVSELVELLTPGEEDPLAPYVEGIEDKEIKKGTEPTTITWMDGISWNKNYIKNIVVDFSEVNAKKAGTYDVHYKLYGVSGQIEVIDSSVKVVSVEKAKKKTTKKKSTKKAKKSEKSTETTSEKTSSSTETKSTSTTKNTTSQGSSSTTKNTTTEKKSSTPKNNSSSGSSTKKETSTTEKKHEHNWKPIYKTVHHKAVTHQEDQGHYEKEAYEVYVYYDYGVEFDADDKAGIREFGLSILNKIASGELPEDAPCRGRLEERYRKKWVSKMVTVVDKKAYDEKVIVGYKCSCGAKKNK